MTVGQVGKRPVAPVARRERRTRVVHGRELVDDYDWLREREAPEVRAHLEAENAHTEAVTADLEELRERLYEEMLGRIEETDVSAPTRDGDWDYYVRTARGLAYPIHCRRPASDRPLTTAEPHEEVLLDVNDLASGHDFFEIGALALSHDHRLLAYSYDTDGDERFRLVIKDLESGELLPDVIEDVYYPLAWATDDRTFFYATLDDAHRPWRIVRHRLGEAPADDVVVFEEGDERFFVDVSLTRSKRFLVISSASSVTSECHLLEADEPGGVWRCFARRRHEVEYDVDHLVDRGGERFLVLTNLEAKNFRIVEADVDRTEMAAWRDWIPHREEVTLEWLDVFADRVVVGERQDGLVHLRVRSLVDGSDHRIEMPEEAYSIGGGGNPEFETDRYRFGYSSLVTPSTVFDYHVEQRRLEVVRRQPVLGGYDPGVYVTRRIHAEAADGTSVPVTVVHRRDLSLDGCNPCLLYGYGAYGMTIDPSFSSLTVSLLDRGFVYAIAHVRGGALLGERWHDDGKLLAKRNSFTDFVVAAEHLIGSGYTRPSRLAIRGGSAGGLLVGAATNLAPETFAVVLAAVPFVDVVNTMLDDTLPLTVIEYEEWGDPVEREAFEAMLDYSPYDNVRDADYPAMLVTAGFNDPRVQYWEPAKWVAKLRRHQQGERPILLKTDLGSGHGGPSGRYAYLRERAFEYAFLIDRLRASPA